MQKATRQQTKEHNTRLVLKSIYDQEGVSRADISRTTQLTKTTVSNIVVDLIAEGLVEESGYGRSEGGKPPILLRIVDEARYFMGIDLADSVFRGATVNLRGEIKNRASIPVKNSDGRAALALVYELIDKLLADSAKPVSGIGIGTPGLMNPEEGVVRRSVNLDWRDLPLRDLLEEQYGLPCYIANDCQAAALGEYTFANQNKSKNLVVVKIGRGIGSGIVMNGALYYGDGYGAGEIGHLVVIKDGETCACGNCGCLETVASTQAVVRRAREIMSADPSSLLRGTASTTADINTDAVFQAFQSGDPAVRGLIVGAGKHLGAALASMVCVLNVRHIVIAGSMSRFGDPLLEAIKDEMGVHAMSILAKETEICSSPLGQDIVIKGAASLLLANELHLV
jgi:glucokinase-like ROK family protein